MGSFKNKFGDTNNQKKRMNIESVESKDSQLSGFFFPIIEDKFEPNENRDSVRKTAEVINKNQQSNLSQQKKQVHSPPILGFDQLPESKWSQFHRKEKDTNLTPLEPSQSWVAFQKKLVKKPSIETTNIKEPVREEKNPTKFSPFEIPPPMHLINNPTQMPIEFELKPLTKIGHTLRDRENVSANEEIETAAAQFVEMEEPLLTTYEDESRNLDDELYPLLDEEMKDEEELIEPELFDEELFRAELFDAELFEEASFVEEFLDEDLFDEETQVEQTLFEKKIQSSPLYENLALHSQEMETVKEEKIEPVNWDHYSFPPIHYLQPRVQGKDDYDWMESQAAILDDTFFHFNVNAKVVHCTQGPSVTRFEIQPEPGVKVNKISNLNDDLKLALAARDIRIEAPIPGKSQVGIEIPNRQSRPVFLREVLESDAFTKNSSPLTVAVGLDISGEPITTDLGKMPHGLVAGSTGSGKSVFINSILMSLLYKASPEDVKLLLIDPKMVELSTYNGIPHLVAPVITDPKAATASLKWAVEEMDRRYELFAAAGVRDIVRYNEKVKNYDGEGIKLPYIVIIIDELADLMMTASQDVEAAICRIAQKARACGMHLIVATQRPSVDVITGLIKSNIATRIAFAVASNIDSRTILDQSGAEKLLGRGDMLFLENGTSKTVRIQGTFVTDDEIEKVVSYVKKQAEPSYLFVSEDLVKTNSTQTQGYEAEIDELFLDACEFAVHTKYISTSSLQRRYRIGYNRAARIIDLMEQNGIISVANGTKPRDVLIAEDDLEVLRELLDMGSI